MALPGPGCPWMGAGLCISTCPYLAKAILEPTSVAMRKRGSGCLKLEKPKMTSANLERLVTKEIQAGGETDSG